LWSVNALGKFRDLFTRHRLRGASGAIFETRKVDAWLLGLSMIMVPASIALSETLLAGALVFRLTAVWKRRTKLYVPRAFWFWLAWAILELLVWLHSPQRRQGLGEIRHLLLIAALFLAVPAMDFMADRVTVWRGIVLTATVGSLVLIGHFTSRLLFYRGNLDPVIYLRGGGLLHHWMIYGIVEAMVFAALLQLFHFYPEERWWLLPVSAINTLAIVLSLTRMLWISCMVLWILHLIWCRSRWVWASPLVPCVLFLLAPGAVRSRVADSVDPAYYSNAERIQMLRVGWEMVRENPFTGIGPGRVNEQYQKYLSLADTLPAYHGHLHNNVVQLAAEFGLPVILAAMVFVSVLFIDLARKCRVAAGRDQQFLCRTSLLGLIAFAVAGMFDYTYGHSLGLILLGFVVLPPLLPVEDKAPDSEPAISALALTDRALGIVLAIAFSPVIFTTCAAVFVLSRRSPLVAHLRIGHGGRPLWMWKLRTMWSKAAPLRSEQVWLQRIEAETTDEKLQLDPRITSRFAAFCRRHSIDELPQLIHVIQGKMSIVGPRPVTRSELERHYGVRTEQVLRIRPGLTGYWQTQGRSRLSYQDRVALDLALADELSLRTYWRVLLKTVPEVLHGKNAR
jgi:exopolysaccharide production protein ExoY